MAQKSRLLKRPWITEKKPFERAVSNYDFYNSTAWRKLSKTFKKENPFCVKCKEQGIITQSTVTDHILPINMGGERLDKSNLQALCSTCHNSKSASEKRGMG